MNNIQLQPPGGMEYLPTMLLQTPQLHAYTFSIDATSPPPIDPGTTIPRTDEVNTIQEMLTSFQTSALFLIGESGVGKSTLAALLYSRFQQAAQNGLPAPTRMIWLSTGAYTTLPDVLAAIISTINRSTDPAFFQLSPEQQIATVVQAMQRPQEQILVVLDGFEELLDTMPQPETSDWGAISPFLNMLQTDLGTSRFLITSYHFPYNIQPDTKSRVHFYTVSNISIPEGIALLHQRQIEGSDEELQRVWQRCRGNIFALTLFSAFMKLNRFSLSYLLHSSDYQHLWNEQVTFRLITAIYSQLNRAQHTLIRTLCLFNEPVPLQGILKVMQAENPALEQSVIEQSVIEHELDLCARLSLIQHTETNGGEQVYMLHPLLHEYIIEHYLEGIKQPPKKNIFVTSIGVTAPTNLRGRNDDEAQQLAIATAYRRVATYYQQLAQKHYWPPEKRHGPQDIEYLLGTIRYLCSGWDWQQACDLLFNEGIYESMIEWGAWNTMICLYKNMLPPVGFIQQRDEGIIYNHLGILYGRLGDYQQSMLYHEQALKLQRFIGDKNGEAITLTNWGELFRILHEWDLARTDFEQALILNKQLRDPQMEIVLLHNLGLLHHTMKEYTQAFSYYQTALKLAYNTRGQTKLDIILANIGVVLYEQGYQVEAIAALLATLQRKALEPATNTFIDAFLDALEAKMGLEAFTRIYKAAQAMQAQVLAKLLV